MEKHKTYKDPPKMNPANCEIRRNDKKQTNCKSLAPGVVSKYITQASSKKDINLKIFSLQNLL